MKQERSRHVLHAQRSQRVANGLALFLDETLRPRELCGQKLVDPLFRQAKLDCLTDGVVDWSAHGVVLPQDIACVAKKRMSTVLFSEILNDSQ